MDRIDAWPAEEGVRRATDLFRRTFGEPMLVATAPGRVNLIGEHTDYNDGLCLPIALPLATYAAVAVRGHDVVRLISGESDQGWEGTLQELSGATGWAAYAAGVVWALREAGHPVAGLDIAVTGCVPLGAGLSSSAALECAVGTGVLQVIEQRVGAEGAAALDTARDTAQDIVRAGIRAESEVAGAPTGGMDQTVSVLGSAGHALLIDCESWQTAQVPFDPAAAGLALVVVDSRVNHSLGALGDGGYASRRADCEAAVRELGVVSLRHVDLDQVATITDDRIRRRARHVVTEIARVETACRLLTEGDWAGFGELMWASHLSLRDDFEISTVELDAIVDLAREAGAVGARMTGGGFGGSAIALLPESRVESFLDAVTREYDDRGWAPPAALIGAAGPAARVLAPEVVDRW